MSKEARAKKLESQHEEDEEGLRRRHGGEREGDCQVVVGGRKQEQ